MSEHDEFTRLQPHDILAEQAVLGAALISPDAVGAAIEQLTAEDFYRGVHAEIFKAIVALRGRGDPADPISVRAEMERRGQLGVIEGGLYLHTLTEAVPTVANVGYHVDQVRRRGVLRRVIAAGGRISQMGFSGDPDDVDGVVAESEAEIRRVAAVADDRISDFSTAGAFVDEPDDHGEWIVPGVLEAQERVIVVASEGAGKSTLARHVWVTVAAGLNPFSFVDIPPRRTLLIDLENPPGIVRRKTRGLINLARQVDGWDDDRCWRWTRPGGLDLKRARDQHLLDRVITDARPALVCMGPLYKSFVDGGERAEQLNSQVAAFLDRMREKHGIALWLETHAPLDQAGTRSLRPMGSGVWSRWPEFGIALRKSREEGDRPNTLLVQRFRGDRDERAWPDKLQRGRPWPFEGVFGEDAYSDPRNYGDRPPPPRAVPDPPAEDAVCPTCNWPRNSLGHDDQCGTAA